jgi:hypothetical protein
MVERKADLADDLIWGVSGRDGIAAFLGLTARQAYYLIENDKLPVRRLGAKTIVASRTQLTAFMTTGSRHE